MKSMRLCATLILSAVTAASFRLAAQNHAPSPAPASATVAPAPPATAAAPVTAPAASPLPVAGPLIVVDNATYDFGKASVGEKVHHIYMVTNSGVGTLQITNVHPSCGCTTVGGWTTNIAPGQSGQIAVQFDTSRYGGGPPITKTIEVYSNAKNEPRKTLLLKGSVWKPIEVTPTVAVISIPPDATNEMTTTVRLVNQTDNPVAFSNATSANKLFTVELKEIKAGKEYQLVVTSHPPYTPGNLPGTVSVNTSLPGTPVINVPVTASVAQPIQVFPPQITLNTMPERWTTNNVTIHGNTTNVLTLSQPKASDSRIYTELQSKGPKGMYNLVVAFPPGFQVEQGKTTEVTLESNNPHVPLITIPIKEYPRPRPVGAMARTQPPIKSSALNTNAPLTHQNPPTPAPAHP
jgi:hypothetical protein